MPAIEVENLSRAFNSLRAVDDISFSVDVGEIFGFLGHNGAGKTTTIRMLSGQLVPTSGRGRVAGCDIVTEQQRLKPLIGVGPNIRISTNACLDARTSNSPRVFMVSIFSASTRLLKRSIYSIELKTK